jgi:hypothetical protein
MEKKNTAKWIIAGMALLACFWAFPGETAQSRPDFKRSSLTITRADGKDFSFRIEVARSEAQQAYGLMFVKDLAADAGMIFPFDPPRPAAFWMKNTLIPLDMLFVNPDHRIGFIARNAKPQDLTPISSEGAVIAVIEIKGGQAKVDGIDVGDKVDSPDLATKAK